MIVLGVCGPNAFKSDIDFKRSKTFFSVAASKALVESSRARIGESFKMARANEIRCFCPPDSVMPDRKSTRLNSSHVKISYAVFCLKKKKKRQKSLYTR